MTSASGTERRVTKCTRVTKCAAKSKLATTRRSSRSQQKTTVKIRKKKLGQLAKRRQPSTSNNLEHRTPNIMKIFKLWKGLENKNSNMDETIARVQEAVKDLRVLLSSEDGNSDASVVNDIIQAGMVPLLVEFIDWPHLTVEACWILTNIASTEKTKVVAESGAVEKLIPLLSINEPNIREQAAWCIGNVAGHSKEYREALLSVPELVSAMVENLERPSTPYLLKNVAFAVSNLCRGNHHAQIIQPFLVALVNNLHRCEDLSVDEDPRIDILWALLHIAKAGEDHVIALVNTGAIPYLVRIVERHFDNKKMLIPTLQCICSIVDAENNNGVDSVIATGFLQHALLLLNSESKQIRKDTCRIISNVALGTSDSVAAIFRVGSCYDLVEKVINLATDDCWEVRREAIWVVSRLFLTASARHVGALVQMNGFDPICDILKVNDFEVLMIAMDALEVALQIDEEYERNYRYLIDECDGFANLEGLQSHPEEKVYEKASGIIMKFFYDGGEEENIAPVDDSKTFLFGITAKERAPLGTPPHYCYTFGDETRVNTIF